MAPVSQSIEVRCDGMLALSYTDNGGNSVTQEDINNGKFEICSDRKNSWNDVWEGMSDE